MGPNRLLQHLRTVHQNSVYHCATAAQVRQLPAASPTAPEPALAIFPLLPLPSQDAVAQGFQRELEHYGKPDSYFVQLPRELQQKRDQLVQSLVAVGMKPIIPEGTYFLVADISEFSEFQCCLGRAEQGGQLSLVLLLGTGTCTNTIQRGEEPRI